MVGLAEGLVSLVFVALGALLVVSAIGLVIVLIQLAIFKE